MSLPQSISPNETLGRGVFSSTQAHRADRGTIPFHVFLERRGEVNISVDRLDFAKPEDMATLGDAVAVGRSVGSVRTFYGWAVIAAYGWAVIAAEDAESNGRRVVATPQPDNPYHADIILPASAAEDYKEQRRHTQELTAASRWRERPVG